MERDIEQASASGTIPTTHKAYIVCGKMGHTQEDCWQRPNLTAEARQGK